MNLRNKIFLLITLAITLNFHCPSTLFAQIDRSKSGLPILEFPSDGSKGYYVILLTGNGGWRELVQTITRYLNSKKIPVLAIDIKKYLFIEKKPAEIAKDLESLVDSYNLKWGEQKVVFIGYSMGAEVLPFAVNCLKDNYLSQLKDLILIAPGQKATFKIKLVDYLFDIERGADVYSELKKLKIKNAFCICDDKEVSVCHYDLKGIIDYEVLTGGHHFGHDYATLSKIVGKRLNVE